MEALGEHAPSDASLRRMFAYWERGERSVRLDAYRRAFMAMYGATAEELGFVSVGSVRVPDVRRPVGTVEPAHHERFPPSLTSTDLPLLGPLVSLEQLRHELAAAAVGTDDTDMAEWDSIAWEYGLTYLATPPDQLLRDLGRDLAVARIQLRGAETDQGRHDLQRVVAFMSVYMAQTMGNLGHHRDSYRWWRIARRAADASGSVEARVWVRGREVLRGLYEHRASDALLRLADEALAISRQPGMGTGSVHAGRAQALAMMGRAPEARRAMDDLYAAADQLPPHVVADTRSMYGWPEYRLRHTESFVYTHLGDSRRAESAQGQALALYPAPLFRERAKVRLHQAMRLIKDGDPAGGSVQAYEAVTELPEDQRIQAVIEVARWTAASVPAAERRRPEVAHLRELVATSPTAD